MNLYRVEKGGLSFHIQPEMLDYYAANGYTIYKSVEEVVENVEKEIESIPDDANVVTPPKE